MRLSLLLQFVFCLLQLLRHLEVADRGARQRIIRINVLIFSLLLLVIAVKHIYNGRFLGFAEDFLIVEVISHVNTEGQIDVLVRAAVIQTQAFDGRTLTDVVAEVDLSAADPLAVAVLLTLFVRVELNFHLKRLLLVDFLASLLHALELALAEQLNALLNSASNVEDAMRFMSVEVNYSFDFVLVQSFLLVRA